MVLIFREQTTYFESYAGFKPSSTKAYEFFWKSYGVKTIT